jgi:prephenate dehydrogenase
VARVASPHIAIIGTGLIGTSIGIRLRAGKKERSFEIVGADRDRGYARAAKKAGALDREVGSLEEAVSGAGLVILAVPVLAAKHIMREMVPYLSEGAIVTDTCSTKADVMDWAEEYLPRGVDFVGGHPMAGKESSGPDAADPSLFEGATWAIIPSTRARERSVNMVLGMIETLGAHPIHVDAKEHDVWAAAVSHMPLVLSVTLFRLLRDSKGWEDASLLSGPAFRDLTRLASGDPTMSTDIVSTNKEAVRHWLQRFREELDNVEQAIENGGDPLRSLFASTQLDRDAWILNPRVAHEVEGLPLPSAQDAMAQFFVGSQYSRLKELTSQGFGIRDEERLRRELGAGDRERDERDR